MLNLYHISQTVNLGYDRYSDAVVAAESPEDAVTIHPRGEEDSPYPQWTIPDADEPGGDWNEYYLLYWTLPQNVKARLIGEAAPGVERGVICASFHAG